MVKTIYTSIYVSSVRLSKAKGDINDIYEYLCISVSIISLIVCGRKIYFNLVFNAIVKAKSSHICSVLVA